MQYRYRLDLQFFSQEKTEKATPQRRQESKRKGQVAKSPEVPAALILLGNLSVQGTEDPEVNKINVVCTGKTKRLD